MGALTWVLTIVLIRFSIDGGKAPLPSLKSPAFEFKFLNRTISISSCVHVCKIKIGYGKMFRV